METLIKKSEELLMGNLPCKIDATTMEILSVALTAILLVKGDIAFKKLPKILQSLNIISDNRTVEEIIAQDLGVKHDSVGENVKVSSTVCRNFDIQGDKIEENVVMVISKKDISKNKMSLIANSIHEFFHLLRQGPRQDRGSYLICFDGICYTKINKATGAKKTKHRYFEEGCVDVYTKMALGFLRMYLEDYIPEKSSILGDIKPAIVNYSYEGYKLPVQVVDLLCNDPEFEHNVEKGFSEYGLPAPLIKYFDSVAGIGSFNELSKELDNLMGLCANDVESPKILGSVQSLQDDIMVFLNENPDSKRAQELTKIAFSDK